MTTLVSTPIPTTMQTMHNQNGTATTTTTAALPPPSPPTTTPLTTTTSTTTTSLLSVLRQHRSIVAAAMAGTCGVVIGYPFDFIKSRMQTHGFRSMNEVFRDTVKHEGFHGFFKGILPPLVTVSIIKSLSFNLYETSRLWLSRGRTDTVIDAAAAGFFSGTAIAMISSPLELIKLQMQLQALQQRLDPKSPVFANNWDCARQIYKSRGVKGFYLGFIPMYFRESIGTAVYFACYEWINRKLSPTGRRSDASSLVHFLAGGMSGMTSWLVIFPVDLVKSRLQKDALVQHPQYRNMMDCIQKTYRTIGLKGFYSGIGPTLVRAFPIHSINFLVYEYFLKLLA